MPINPEKLKALQAQAAARTGGKGSIRRKVTHATKAVNEDEKKIAAAISKLPIRDIPQIDEVSIIKGDGTFMNFNKPKVTGNPEAFTWVVQGFPQVKSATDMLSQLTSNMNPAAMAQIQQLLASMAGNGSLPAGLTESLGAAAGGADGLGDFAGNFEDAANGEAPDLVDA